MTRDEQLIKAALDIAAATCEKSAYAAAALGLDVAGAVIEKNRFNRQRADHKIEARAAGGKKY